MRTFGEERDGPPVACRDLRSCWRGCAWTAALRGRLDPIPALTPPAAPLRSAACRIGRLASIKRIELRRGVFAAGLREGELRALPVCTYGRGGHRVDAGC
jgi:hypothetical protein